MTDTPPESRPRVILEPPKCHIPECGRPALVLSDGRVLPVCGPCRISYLNGIYDASKAAAAELDKHTCAHCGHLTHEGTRCRWHGGKCAEAQADPSLWCQCPVRCT